MKISKRPGLPLRRHGPDPGPDPGSASGQIFHRQILHFPFGEAAFHIDDIGHAHIFQGFCREGGTHPGGAEQDQLAICAEDIFVQDSFVGVGAGWGSSGKLAGPPWVS